MSMRDLSRWLVAWVFCLGMAGSPAAWAALCSQVFPADATQGGVDLTTAIDAVFASQTGYSTFPTSKVIHYDSPGQWLYQSASLDTRDVITVKAGATTWLFFDGDLNLQPQSSINPLSAALDSGGNPEDLIIIVRGTLNIGTNNVINALMYATGNVIVQPNANIAGAITAKGTVTVQNPGNTTIAYDADAAASFDLPGACSAQTVDHFRLDYGSPGLTCQPHSVQVTACGDAACSSRVVAAGSVVARNVVTGNDLAYASFTTSTNGTAVVQLAVTTEATVSLRVAGSTTQCTTAGCQLLFSGSGLQVTVPDLIAGQADVINVAHCDPLVANTTLPVQFWSTYRDPDAAQQVGNQRVLVNGTAMGRSQSEVTTVSLGFVNGSATVPLSYSDAGVLQLQARTSFMDKKNEIVLAGVSRPFVSRPYALQVTADGLDATGCFGPGGVLTLDTPGCPKWTAGDDFLLRIRPVALDGTTTRNFSLENIDLSSTVEAPSGSVNNGSLSVASYSHPLDPEGDGYVIPLQQSEVGIFRLTAKPRANTYFGYTVSTGTSGPVGRFIPAYLDVKVESAVLLPGCVGSSFTYQDQPMSFSDSAMLKLTGMNRQGDPTKNYDHADFWRFDKALEHRFFSATGRSELDRRVLVDDPATDCNASDPERDCKAARVAGGSTFALLADDVPGDGSRAYRFTDKPTYLRNPDGPQDSDLPVNALLRLFIANSQLEDRDGIYYSKDKGVVRADYLTAGTPEEPLISGSEVRLGRLRIDEASGAENQSLDLPYWLETLQAPGGVWGKTTDDYCSTPTVLGQVVLSDFTGDLQASHFLQPPASPGTLEPPSGTPLPSGLIRLPPPGKQGRVLVRLSGQGGVFPGWLLYDWQGNGLEPPSAWATFGSQSVQRALIFRREVYR